MWGYPSSLLVRGLPCAAVSAAVGRRSLRWPPVRLLLLPVERLLLLVGGQRRPLVDRRRRRRLVVERLVEPLLRRGEQIERDERCERGERLGRCERRGCDRRREELLLDEVRRDDLVEDRLDGLVEAPAPPAAGRAAA